MDDGLPYFAYGSNLNFDDLADRAPELLERLTVRAPAWLPDHELAFTRRSSGRRGGVLDVRPRRGAAVHGMLFDVAAGGLERLDDKEGAPTAYARRSVVVLGEDGDEIAALTYRVVQPERFVVPSADYLALVRAGREAFGIETAELDLAAADRSSRRDALFAYGTLMRGEVREGVVAALGSLAIEPARCTGALWDLGSYPGLTLGGEDDAPVRGELIRGPGLTDGLERLDAVEGFEGYGDADNLFRRVIVSATVDDGSTAWAWAYLDAKAAREVRIVSGDWRMHRQARPSP